MMTGEYSEKFIEAVRQRADDIGVVWWTTIVCLTEDEWQRVSRMTKYQATKLLDDLAHRQATPTTHPIGMPHRKVPR